MKKVFLLFALTTLLCSCEKKPTDAKIEVSFTEEASYDFTTGEQTTIPFTVKGKDLTELTFDVDIKSYAEWTVSVKAEVKGELCVGDVTVKAADKQSNASLTLSVKDKAGNLWITKATLTAIAPLETAKNLSQKGSANCYIISSKGDYMFDATKRGNGSGENASIAITNNMSANWLWTTTGLKDAISDIRFDKDSGRIFFTTKEEFQGNALITLNDETGAIVWSWHLWFTNTPSEITYKSGKIMLDRSIGAISTDPGEATAYGLYYQWGRKDPFCGGITTETSATAFAEATVNTIINPTFAETHKWKQETGAGVSTIAYAISNPLSFISNKNATTGYYDWLVRGENNLWNTTKTIYDPCPIGYKVPDRDSWDDFANADDCYIDGVTEWNGEKYGVTYINNGAKDWYPTQGYRNKDKGNLVGLSTTRTGHYWSNSRSGNTISCLYISKKLSSGKLLQPQSTSKSDAAFGYNVRCVKE